MANSAAADRFCGNPPHHPAVSGDRDGGTNKLLMPGPPSVDPFRLMKTIVLRASALAVATWGVFSTPISVHASAHADSRLILDNFTIMPSAGSVQLLTNWFLTAWANADGIQDYDEGWVPPVSATSPLDFFHGHQRPVCHRAPDAQYLRLCGHSLGDFWPTTGPRLFRRSCHMG